MKILHIVGNEYKPGNGIFIIVDTLIRELNNRGIKTELLLLKDSDINSDYTINSYNKLTNIEEFFQNNHYDLAVFNGFFFIEYRHISKILKKLNIPYIIKPHSSFMKEALKKGYFKKRIAIYLLLYKFISNSKAIIFSNNEEKNNSISFGKRTFIETNGLNLDNIRNYESDSKSTNNIKLIFLSRYDINHKGIDTLIKGYSIFQKKHNENSKNVELILYGKGSQKDEYKINKMICGIKNIKINGPIFGIEKDKLLKASDILILTSRYEGFPTIIMDALLCGLPAIVTPGTNSTFLENNLIGWVTNIDKNEIADCINRAVIDIKNKRINKRDCIDYVCKNHDIHITVKETIELYKQVFNKNSI